MNKSCFREAEAMKKRYNYTIFVKKEEDSEEWLCGLYYPKSYKEIGTILNKVYGRLSHDKTFNGTKYVAYNQVVLKRFDTAKEAYVWRGGR